MISSKASHKDQLENIYREILTELYHIKRHGPDSIEGDQDCNDPLLDAIDRQLAVRKALHVHGCSFERIIKIEDECKLREVAV